MKRMRGLALGAAAVLGVAAAPAGDPAGYALRLPVRTDAGAVLQRLSIPAAALAAARTTDLADLRVFDARGRAMPIARASAPPVLRRTALTPMPILGPADALKVSGVSLTLDSDGKARVAEVSGSPAAAGTTLAGVLLDARAVGGEAESLLLDADLPQGQPVTLTVAASPDLSTWRMLGERTLYRAPGRAAAGETVPLGRAPLERDYLRVTWRAGSRLLGPVQVRRATLVGPAAGAAVRHIEAAAPPLADAHRIDIALPFATPIATLRVTVQGDDLVVPVRILGRDTDERPWTLLATGVATAGASEDLALGGATMRMLRIEADGPSPGFTAPPRFRFGFAPRNLLFAAAGEPPFTLAVGRPGATDAYLPAESVMRAAGRTTAVATTADRPAILRLAAPADGGAGRRLLLWLVLLAATGLLAALAWLLWKRSPPERGSDAAVDGS